MAAVALRAVFTQMAVILVMTAAAHGRILHRAGRLMMTLSALQLGVSTQQCEVVRRLLCMIERPQRPTVGRVAALAFLAEAAFVHVVVRMAIDARDGCATECQS